MRYIAVSVSYYTRKCMPSKISDNENSVKKLIVWTSSYLMLLALYCGNRVLKSCYSHKIYLNYTRPIQDVGENAYFDHARSRILYIIIIVSILAGSLPTVSPTEYCIPCIYGPSLVSNLFGT